MKNYKFYTNSGDAWLAMLEAIKRAKKSVYWESYIAEDDLEAEYDFFDILLDKLESGVKVRIVLDGFGSFRLSQDTVDRLRGAGAEVLFFNSWFRRIHRKVLIIDKTVAFLGGVNVGQKYKRWLDLHIKLMGKNIVGSLLRSFSRSYFYSGGQDEELLKLRKESLIRKTELWLLEHFPWTGRLMLDRYYKEKVARAKNRIVLVTPYFVPHRWLVRLLKAARARGVIVEVIIPNNTDVKFLNFINHIFVSSLDKSGIKFYLTKDMIHAKALLVDDKIGLVGSNNIDAWSFDFNAEASVSFEQKGMINDLKKIIEKWRNDAIPFRNENQSSSWFYRVIEKLVRFLQPIL